MKRQKTMGVLVIFGIFLLIFVLGNSKNSVLNHIGWYAFSDYNKIPIKIIVINPLNGGQSIVSPQEIGIRSKDIKRFFIENEVSVFPIDLVDSENGDLVIKKNMGLKKYIHDDELLDKELGKYQEGLKESIAFIIKNMHVEILQKAFPTNIVGDVRDSKLIRMAFFLLLLDFVLIVFLTINISNKGED
ncbi:MAG: hypothetical protein KKA54_20700 [Proteobacteria bacterium]|nr:hypothetical protein [Pseudomonadota bacterium]MBU0968788.1 hypothetical protein [Pseudomonadota bacterium]